jgi:dTDP-4-amino-4,6-dideoxy-D-galactose acyltransferase
MTPILPRTEQLYFYSPYSFIREFPADKQIEHCILPSLTGFTATPGNEIVTIEVNNCKHFFYTSFLKWDTDYFGFSTYRLRYVLFEHSDTALLTRAVHKFMEQFFTEKKYCFAEIPSEDHRLLQALGSCGFRLVETRLTYFTNDLFSFDNDRYKVRKAVETDIPNLMRVAREMRNNFDRFHADPVFDPALADEFLATYIEQSVKGYADSVLVPDEQDVPADSFLTAKYLKEEWSLTGVNVSKMVLSAVSSTTNKGWYKKLVSEMTCHLRGAGAHYIFMNTQSSNRAVVHCWESLGYRFGAATHIVSYDNLL